MEFLKENNDPRIVQEQFEAYRAYIESIREILPSETFYFATASWHYDTRHSQCLHDSWVEFLNISEIAERDDVSARHISIHVRLLGAYHDGYTDLVYKKVRCYALNAPADSHATTKYSLGHGDWLTDEIRLSKHGSVIHEVAFFSNEHAWTIQCEDIHYKWTPIDKSQLKSE
ncbi:MAG: hypothetical protein ACREEM_24885 [Blastocatellia bacterium]